MRNLKILFSYLGAYRRDAILGVFFVSVETVLELFIPVIMANIIDVGVPAGDINYMLLQGTYMLVCAAFSLVLGLGYARTSARVASGLGANLREAEYRKIQTLAFGNLDNYDASSLVTRMTTDITFVSTQELEDLYPDKTPKERENAFVKDHPVTFLMGIGGKLHSGKPHDGRAPDYDDWDLNGDLLVWDSVNGQALELSSMGIRVSPESLDRQLTLAGCDNRRELPFHKQLLAGELPYTMGGGIGQSRVSMFLLGKAHIGEVQCSMWDEANIEACKKAGVTLL